MSSENKKPDEFGTPPKYRAHYELWSDEWATEPAPEPDAILVAEAVTAANVASGGAPAATSQEELLIETAPALSEESIAEAAVPKNGASGAETASASNALPVWTTPILSTTPLTNGPVPSTAPPPIAPRKATAMLAVSTVSTTTPRRTTMLSPAAHPASDAAKVALWTLVAAIGAVVAVLVISPWKSKKPVASSVNIPAPPAAKIEVSPQAMPSLAISAPQASHEPLPKASVAPPANVAVVVPMKPAAAPSVTSVNPAAAPSTTASAKLSSIPNAPSATRPPAEPEDEGESANGGEPDEYVPVRKLVVQSSIQSQLARAGFASLGVSVTDGGDVFLEGTFLNLADEERAISIVRGTRGVHDIYFSGTVWHDVTPHSEQASVPPPSSVLPGTNPSTASVPAVAPLAAAAPAGSTPSVNPPPTIAHSVAPPGEDFPVTAADAPLPGNRYTPPSQQHYGPAPPPDQWPDDSSP
jgi:hypothetical protein